MKKIYAFAKHATVAVAVCFGSLFSTQAFGQATPPCGVLVESFNSSAGGFTSSTVNSPAAGFTYNSTDHNLQRCDVQSGGTVFQIVTPTYKTLSSQTDVGYGFTLGGAVKVSRVVVLLQYVGNNGALNTVEVSNFAPTYSNSGSSGVAVECRGFSMATYAGFDPGENYRFIFQFTATSASSNANQCITFDDFRTTGNGNQAPLPVTFTNFSVKKGTNGVDVFWNIAAEKNVLRYEIERSADGKDFTTVGQIASNDNNGYMFTDKQPLNGVSFYRVRNVDRDGKSDVTSIARVNLSKVIALRAFPQPANNELTIEHNGVSSKGTLTLSAADGRVVYRTNVKPDVTQTVINLAAFRSGMYLVRFDSGNGEVETVKLIKQ